VTTPATDKLTRLIERCKGSVTITINEHRNTRWNLVDWLSVGATCMYFRDEEISQETRMKMVASGMVVNVVAYPDNAVGFYSVWEASLDAALDLALRCIDQEEKACSGQ